MTKFFVAVSLLALSACTRPVVEPDASPEVVESDATEGTAAEVTAPEDGSVAPAEGSVEVDAEGSVEHDVEVEVLETPAEGSAE